MDAGTDMDMDMDMDMVVDVEDANRDAGTGIDMDANVDAGAPGTDMDVDADPSSESAGDGVRCSHDACGATTPGTGATPLWRNVAGMADVPDGVYCNACGLFATRHGRLPDDATMERRRRRARRLGGVTVPRPSTPPSRRSRASHAAREARKAAAAESQRAADAERRRVAAKAQEAAVAKQKAADAFRFAASEAKALARHLTANEPSYASYWDAVDSGRYAPHKDAETEWRNWVGFVREVRDAAAVNAAALWESMRIEAGGLAARVML
jgi:hypothetical protein